MDKLTPKSNKGNIMKKNKSKVPAVKTISPINIDNMGIEDLNKLVDKMTPQEREKFSQQILGKIKTNEDVDNMCKEFDKMTPEEKEKFKQETLQNLRKSIRNMVDGSKRANVALKNNPKDHYVLNAQNKLAVENNIDDLIKYKPLNEKETELLKSRVSEYLKTFVIFGYDMNGSRILITNSKTVQDNDSIFSMSQHIPMVLFQIFNNGHLPDNSDMF